MCVCERERRKTDRVGERERGRYRHGEVGKGREKSYRQTNRETEAER